MKPLVVLLSFLGGAIIAGGVLHWRDAAAISSLQTQLAELRTQAEADQSERDHRAKAASAELDELAQKLAAADAARAAADTQRQQLAAELAKLRRDFQATQREYLAAQAALAKAEANTQAGSSAPAPVPTTHFDAAQETVTHAQMARRYNALIQKLGLSPADADRFLGLMVSRRHAADDVIVAEQDSGATPTADTVAGLVSTTRDSIESDIHSLLGDAGFAQFQAYESAAGTTGTMARLQRSLVDTAPLDDGQAQQLQQLIADRGVGHLTPSVIQQAQAQGFLTPEQIQALQALYAQQRAAQLQRRTGVAPPGTH